MFLTKEEVADLTGHYRPAIQVRWLRTNAIPFILGGDGRPKVPKQALLDKVERDTFPDDQPADPTVCRLIDITENWDKVSESMMAELIGTTARSLQGKRSREAIPRSVWSKVDGSIMYSLKRYEAFLDAQWPTYIPVTTELKKPNAADLRRQRNGKTTQAKPVTFLV